MMFLQHANTLGFLNLDPESQVFMVFPIAARKTLAATTVECLLNLNPHPDKITTSSHMRSLMEIVGQAFDLPFEEDGTSVVASALDVYKLWLCSATYQPSPVREDPEFFTSRMLRHISMVFRPRTGAIDRHIQIGKKALDVYVQVAKEAGPLFSAETWTEFLKLYLAVADSLLSQDVDAVPLADQLQGHVLRVLFEIWFLSLNQDEDVWSIWKSLMINWRHRLSTITAWTSVLYGLVQRVLGIAYGEGMGAQAVSFNVGDVSVTLQVDDDHAMYLMYKTLHLVGDLEEIEDPGIYNEAIRGLGFLSTSLINAQSKIRKIGMVAPDGNSILHLLGPHLLEAITQFPRQLEHGKATALEAVTKLFLRKANQTDFHPRYLAMYYHGLEAALKSGSGHLLSIVLTSCQRLFGVNFRGVNMLIPSFMAAVTNVLMCKTQIKGVHGSMALLRRAALNLLMQLVCWPNHYGMINFKTRDPLEVKSSALPEIVSYEDLNPYIHFALIQSIDTVTEAQNHGLMFDVALVFIAENLDKDLSFAREFLADVLGMLAERRWEHSSVMDALQFLDDLSSMVDVVNGDGAQSPEVVHTLCLVIMDIFDTSISSVAPAEDMACALFHCIHRWLDGTWIVRDYELLHKVWSCVQMVLQGQPPNFHPATEEVQEAALFCANHLLSRLGHAGDPEFPTSLIREEQLLAKNQVRPSDLMCYMLDGNLFTLIREPKEQDKISLTVIMRTPQGTNSWRCALNYFPTEIVDVPEFDHDNTPVLPEVKDARILENQELVLDAIFDTMNEEQRTLHESMQDAVEERLIAMEDARAHLECEATVLPVERPMFTRSGEEWENVASRMFMATFGFLSRNFVSRVCLVHHSKIEEVLDFVDRFDATSVRESYSVGLVYVPRDGIESFSSCRDGSLRFQEFVEGLGFKASTSNHAEFILDPYVVGDELVMTCDRDTAVAYVSPCWMPDDAEEDQEELLTTMLDVLVCWCEDAEEYKYKTRASYTICIEPLPSGLHRIKVLMKSGAALCGPLVDGTVVSLYALPHLLTRTVINMSRAALGNFLHDQSLARRKEALEEFYRETIQIPPKLVATWINANAQPDDE